MIYNFDEHSIEVIPDWGWDGSSIFKAATTCYRSEEYTKKTPDDFIRILKNNKHTAMLEFMWIVFFIESYNQDLMIYLAKNKYFKIIETKEGMYVGGNARAWYEFYLQLSIFNITNSHTLSIISHMSGKLQEINPTLFRNIPSFITPITDMINNNISLFKSNREVPGQYHQLKWYMIKLRNVSRGLSHEIVRHRTMSFAQASTRYINNSSFNMIFPVDDYPEFAGDVGRVYELIRSVYSEMIKDNKVPKNIARQILPIGLSNEICIAGTLDDWNKLFKLRCDKAAHPEIRKVCSDIRDCIYEDL